MHGVGENKLLDPRQVLPLGEGPFWPSLTSLDDLMGRYLDSPLSPLLLPTGTVPREQGVNTGTLVSQPASMTLPDSQANDFTVERPCLLSWQRKFVGWKEREWQWVRTNEVQEC